MRIHSFVALSCALFAWVVPGWTITLQEIAGVYIGKRTESYQTEVRRFNEIVVIESDGTVLNYIGFDGEFILASTGTIELGEDGAFGNDEAAGRLQLHGRHLQVEVKFSPPHYPDVVVAFQGRRSNFNPIDSFAPASADASSLLSIGWDPAE